MDRMRLIPVILAVLLGLTACREARGPAPAPIATVELAEIHLVLYVDRDLGIRGVIPDGWFETMPGLFPGMYLASPPETRPGTVLIQPLEAGATFDQAAEEWAPRLGLEEEPKLTGSRESGVG